MMRRTRTSPEPQRRSPGPRIHHQSVRIQIPAWMLCLEIFDVDWTLIGPLGMLWGTV